MALTLKHDLRRPVLAAISGVRGQRVVVLCAGVMLLALIAYLAASYGFNAVVQCEENTYSVLGQSRTVMSQIVSSSACGF
jgi:hypothetical protein